LSAAGATRITRPELSRLVAEASKALACLDAGRLQELELACEALHGEWPATAVRDPARARREARAALGEMATLARVLEATRSNLKVMRRLQALREGRIEYSAREAAAVWPAGDGHGHN
jgi:hypothetical protein